MKVDIGIKKGSDIGDDEFPLYSETLQYVDLIMEVDDFGVTYFADQLDTDATYAVMRTEEYRSLPRNSRRQVRDKIVEWKLDGSQSTEALQGFVDDLVVNTVDRVVSDIAGIDERGLTDQERAEIDALVKDVEATYDDAATEHLDEFMANTNVGRMLDSGDCFLELPPADEATLARIREVRMPAYFVLDVSYSMDFEGRIDYARDFVMRVSRYLHTKQIVDDLKCLIYWGQCEYVDLMKPKRFRVGQATHTGEAIRLVAEDIRAAGSGQPTFLALVTDGLPNCEGEYQGRVLSPVDYTVQMASLLPDNVIFSQIAFPPLDPGDPDRPESLEEFQAYLDDLKRVTDAVKHGQTYVLVKQSEHHLPWIPLGAYQKARQLSLAGQDFAVIEDL